MEEKRSHPRLPITARVSLSGSDEVSYYFTKDLSLSGLFLQREEPLDIGHEVHLELAIQGMDHLIKIRAEVVRFVKPPDGGVGLNFKEIDPDGYDDFKKFILSRNDG